MNSRHLNFVLLSGFVVGCAASGSSAESDDGSTSSGAQTSAGGSAGGTPVGAGGNSTAVGGAGSSTGGSGAGNGSGGAGGNGTGGEGGNGTGGAGGNGTGGAGGNGAINNTPCATGDGYALWRIQWDSNSAGYADVQAWDNGCTYSLANQACSLSGEPHDYANWGPGVVFNSSTDYFRVRFSAQGLSFSSATIYMGAHADGSGIPNAVLESPIYGNVMFAPTVPISQHRTYAVDWTDYLSPTDSPSLTAVTLRSQPSGLGVSFMELCVE